MKSILRARFYFAAGLATLYGSTAVLTLLWPDWLELLTGLQLDYHQGSFERIVVSGLFLAGIFGYVAAWAEWRQSKLAGALNR